VRFENRGQTTKDRTTFAMRVVGALLISGGLATYAIYGRHFYADFIAECSNLPAANSNDADDGSLDRATITTLAC
jgi:hypothetical protein